MAHVIRFTDFDVSQLQFGRLELNQRGGKSVPVTLGKRRDITFQTPVVKVPFGVKAFLSKTGKVESISCDVSFKGADNDPELQAFMKTMHDLDERLLSVAEENSAEWFGEAASRDALKMLMRPLVKLPSQEQYSPTLKVKVPLINGETKTTFFDENRDPVESSVVTKGSRVIMILELAPSVWFVNKTFGMTLRLAQCAVKERGDKFDNYAIVDDS
jgi:hypothetical protein